MKKQALLAVVLAAPIVGTVVAQSASEPKKAEPPVAQHEVGAMTAEQMASMMPPPPGEHHKWLEQLVGTWTVESEMNPGGGEAMKSKGTETVRSLDGRWVISDLTLESPGMGTMKAVMTLGYNAQKGKYQGTWVDSMTDQLWMYDITLDVTGKVLTMEADGPNMMDPSKGTMRFRDVIEFKSADHRTLTSAALVDGKWMQFGTSHFRRTK